MPLNTPHIIQARVYYEDTDAGGIIYHANYLRFSERGRTEFLRNLGFDHGQVKADHGLILVVRRMNIDYLCPGILDDLLTISTEVIEMKNSSMTMRQIIRRDETILAEMDVVIVAVGNSGRAVRIPPQLRQIFEA